MRNCPMESIGEYDDISTKDQYQAALNAGCTEKEALDACIRMSRDNARTPMQWSGEEKAGFTKGTPWLKVNPNYTEINVADQADDEDSVLNFYRKMIALRKSEEYRELFTYGSFVPELEAEEGVFAYVRADEESGRRVLVAANFGRDEKTVTLKNPVDAVLLTNDDRESEGRICTIDESGSKMTLASCALAVLKCADSRK